MFVRYNIYTFLWFLLIATLVLLPGREMPMLGSSLISIDKAIHSFLFLIMTFLMVVGFAKQSRYSSLRNKALKYSLITTITYAIIIEAVQLLSDGRSFELGDMAANLGGCFVGYLLFIAIYK